MSKVDHRINKFGIDVNHLKVGHIVKLTWDTDLPNSETRIGIVIRMEGRPASYKKDQSHTVLVKMVLSNLRLKVLLVTLLVVG